VHCACFRRFISILSEFHQFYLLIFRWMSLGCLKSRPSRTKPLVSNLNQLTTYYLTAHYPYCIVHILFLIMLNLCRPYYYSKLCDTLNLWKLTGNLGQRFFFWLFNIWFKIQDDYFISFFLKVFPDFTWLSYVYRIYAKRKFYSRIKMATYHEVPQEEDAAELTFPKEFENAETLLISEVKIVNNAYCNIPNFIFSLWF